MALFFFKGPTRSCCRTYTPKSGQGRNSDETPRSNVPSSSMVVFFCVNGFVFFPSVDEQRSPLKTVVNTAVSSAYVRIVSYLTSGGNATLGDASGESESGVYLQCLLKLISLHPHKSVFASRVIGSSKCLYVYLFRYLPSTQAVEMSR